MGTTLIHTPLGRAREAGTHHTGEIGEGIRTPQRRAGGRGTEKGWALVLSTCIREATALVQAQVRALCGSGPRGG